MSEEDFGRRLRRARVVAGLSRSQVATALAVRRADVARIEHGRRRVSTRELDQLARLYRKPSAECLVAPAGAPPIRYLRSDHRLDERDLAVIEEVGDWLAYYAWLERGALGAQRYEFPTYPLPAGDPVEQGECLAAEERNRLGLGDGDPIPSMVALLEREGVKVVAQAFHPKSRAFGCFLFSEALGPSVVINRRRAPSERRFAAAHEYAHLLMDQEDISGAVCGPFRAHELDEQRAHAFATAFLPQRDGVSAALRDVDAHESEPVRFRSVAVEAWHCGRITTAKLADLLDLPEADVALLLHHAPLEHEA